MVFRITSGITIDGGLTSSGREPDPPTDINAAKVNDDTVRLTVTDPVNTGGLPITTYTANAYIEYEDVTSQEQTYDVPGTYSWVAPVDVTSVCVVCVGGGGSGAIQGTGATYRSGGGGGGGLGWKNNIPVTPGQSYTVVVGAGGQGGSTNSSAFSGNNGNDSYFISPTLVKGGGGEAGRGREGSTYGGGLGGTYVGDGGGNGGNGGGDTTTVNEIKGGGGGGAGGYTGNGGNGGFGQGNSTPGTQPTNGSGGGGAGGAAEYGTFNGNGNASGAAGGGGGVGLLGQGSNGIAPTNVFYDQNAAGGGGGSGGASGGSTDTGFAYANKGGTGGDFGGGSGGATGVGQSLSPIITTRNGGGGAVRIIWAANMSFPYDATATPRAPGYELVKSTTSNNNIIDVTNNYGGGSGPVEYVFDGATFYEIPYNSKFNWSTITTTSITIEAFITPTVSNRKMGIVNNWYFGGAFDFYINSNNTLTFTYTHSSSGISQTTLVGSTVIQPNVRTHVVMQKMSNIVRFFINGVVDPVGLSNAPMNIYFYQNETKPLRYGIGGDGNDYFIGKMSNLRITNKSYLYGAGINASFPVPSIPLEITQPLVSAVVAGSTRSVIETLDGSETILLVLSDARPGKDKSSNDFSSALSGTMTITGGVNYAFRVAARNAAGISTESTISNTIRYLGPNAPTIGTATIVNNTNASVTFTPPAVNVDGPILDYLVVSNPGNFNAIGTSSPLTVSGLIKGTNYTFTVSARNKFAQGTASSASNSVTAIGIPDVPIAGTATITSATTATVTFSPPVNTGGLPITQYMVYSGSPGATEKLVTSSPALITGLSAGNTYSFRVYAYNSLGYGVPTAESSAMTAAFLPPNAPIIGSAVLTAVGTASVSFTAPPSNNGPSPISYTVTSSPGGLTATGVSSPISINGLASGTTYTFTVKATNIIGTGPESSASNSVKQIGPGQTQFSGNGSTGAPRDQIKTWVVPDGVTLISVVAVGGGGGGQGGNTTGPGKGGSGGALAYVNDIPVTPGETLEYLAGEGGGEGNWPGVTFNDGEDSWLRRGSTYLVHAGGGKKGGTGGGTFTPGGTVIVGTGGNGGEGGSGGGGAGGYAGKGGAGGSGGGTGTAGAGGGGGGAGSGIFSSNKSGGGGGGVGLRGQGNNGGATSSYGIGGSGGSGGSAGQDQQDLRGAPGSQIPSGGHGSWLGGFGGGGGGGRTVTSGVSSGGMGGVGGIRIIWPGTFGPTRTFPTTNTEDIVYVDYVVVGGGGGGGIGGASYLQCAGGGGGGGVLSAGVLLTGRVTYTITVGAGGSGGYSSGTSGLSLTAPSNGGPSSISGTGFTTVSATGGGCGASSNVFGSGSGGSGGGGSANSNVSVLAAGSGTTGQGNNGGSAFGSSTGPLGGGGGGAGGVGQSGNAGGSGRAGSGGNGLSNPFPVGPSVLAGGGGGSGTNGINELSGAGGSGVGGNGYFGNYNAGSTSGSGATGTGSGGGGLSGGGGNQYITSNAGNGGSGVVMLRFDATLSPVVTGSPTITTVGNYNYYRWNGNGSVRF